MQFSLVYTKSLDYKTRLTRGYLKQILIAIQNFTSQLFKSAVDMTPWPNSYQKGGGGGNWLGAIFGLWRIKNQSRIQPAFIPVPVLRQNSMHLLEYIPLTLPSFRNSAEEKNCSVSYS